MDITSHQKTPPILHFLRFLVIGGLISSIGIVIKSFLESKNWETNEDAKEQDKKDRVQVRGTIVSILSAVILVVIGGIFAKKCVPDIHIEILFGYLFAPIIGYMLDVSIGTDKGLSTFKENKTEWIKYMFSSLAKISFFRFVVTFLLDMFISQPIVGVVKTYTRTKLLNVPMTNMLDTFIKDNLPGIIQGIVGFITFQSYTNQSRFLWAYPDTTDDKIEPIPSFTIMMAIAISASMFLYTTRKDTTNATLNISLVLFAFMLVTVLSKYNYMDAENDPEDKVDTKTTFTGMGVFIISILIGIVFPIFQMQSRGVYGLCKLR